MKNKKYRQALILLFVLSAAVAGGMYFLHQSTSSVTARWYSAAQAQAGEKIYTQHCIACHGERGQATADWRQKNADGSYPPPPLNGTAHTWHHSMAVLRRQIINGGVPLGGNMPAFATVLNEDEIDSVIAYIQSQWNDDVYTIWRDKVNK